jgi:nucleoside-diphosphate-sugar epimerase
MDKAVIFGVYDFISFHLCKALLDIGFEVTGVILESEREIDFLDEKRLEIGRNANYTEYPYSNWIHTYEETEAIVLSLYDLYMQYKETILKESEMKELLTNYFSKIQNRSLKFIILAPSQLLTKPIEEKSFKVIEDFIMKLNELTPQVQLFYLPAIFGPWQPESFMYQHTIVNKIQRNSNFKGIREDTGDVLYIKDVIDLIIDLMDSGKPGSYLVESGMKGQWELGAAYLQIQEVLTKERNLLNQNESITKVKVNSITAITEGINKQIELTKRLYKE